MTRSPGMNEVIQFSQYPLDQENGKVVPRLSATDSVTRFSSLPTVPQPPRSDQSWSWGTPRGSPYFPAQHNTEQELLQSNTQERLSSVWKSRAPSRQCDFIWEVPHSTCFNSQRKSFQTSLTLENNQRVWSQNLMDYFAQSWVVLKEFTLNGQLNIFTEIHSQALKSVCKPSSKAFWVLRFRKDYLEIYRLVLQSKK